MRTARFVVDFFCQYKGYAVAYALLALATPLSEVLLPYYYGQIIEKLGEKQPVTKLLITIVVLWIVCQLMFMAMDKLDAIVVPDLQVYIKSRVFDVILEKHFHKNDDIEIGRIIDRLSKLPIILTDLFIETRNYILPALYVMIFATGYFYYVNVYLGLITMILILMFFAIVYFLKDMFHDSMMSKKQSELSEELSDILENLNNVYSCGTIDPEKERVGVKHEEYKQAARGTYSKAATLKMILNAFYIVTFIAINGFTYYLYTKGKIDISTLSSVFIIVLYMLSQFITVSGEITSVIQNMSVVDELDEYLCSLSEYKSDTASDIRDAFLGDITLRDIDYDLPSRKLFDKLNLSFRRGSSTCIFGKVGSGKTTIVNLIMGYCVPTSGDVLFDMNVRSFKDVRDNVSYVRQNHRLFNRSLYENISYGTDIEADAIIQLMKRFDLEKVFSNHTLEEDVGKNGCHLSGGQRQMVLLLRAMIRNRPILILDEPTSAMDEDTRNVVLKFIRQAFANKTVIFITHDPHIKKTYGFDRILDMKDVVG